MRISYNLLPFMMIASALLCGCNGFQTLANMFKGSDPASRGAEKGELGERQLERDPMPMARKGGVGIEYDPRNWKAQFYDPSAIGNIIHSTGAKGVTQHTFIESGAVLHIDLSHDGRYMTYASTQYSRTPQICMQGTDSKAVQVLTQDTMSDMMPKLSPPNIAARQGEQTGQYIAWCSDRYGNWDILIQRADGSPDAQPRQLTRSTDDDIHPTWSPDGKYIAFCRFNSMDGMWQIWVLNLENRVLSHVTEGLFPKFRPVGDQPGEYTLVYQRHRKRDVPWYSIWTTRISPSADGRVETVEAPIEIVANHNWAAITPTWSPNGNYIAFATVRKSTLAQWQARIYKPDDVWVVRVDGTDLTQITDHPAPDWNPSWALDPNKPDDPTGRIYFTSERSGHANIWSVKPVVAGLVVQRTE